MKRRMISKLIKALSYFLVSFAIGSFIVMITQDSPSRKAYGVLSGWWAALYLCSYLNIGIKDFWYVVSLDILVVACSAYISPDFASSMADIASSFFFLLSPFLANLSLVVIKARLWKMAAKQLAEQENDLPPS